jgi:hypothetical protein
MSLIPPKRDIIDSYKYRREYGPLFSIIETLLAWFVVVPIPTAVIFALLIDRLTLRQYELPFFIHFVLVFGIGVICFFILFALVAKNENLLRSVTRRLDKRHKEIRERLEADEKQENDSNLRWIERQTNAENFRTLMTLHQDTRESLNALERRVTANLYVLIALVVILLVFEIASKVF